MDSKSIFATKTFWVSVLSPVVGWLAGHVFHWDADTTKTVVETAATLAPVFIATRLATNSPAHVIPPQ